MQWKNTIKFIATTPTIIAISILGIAVPQALADIVCRGTIYRYGGDNLSFSVPWSPNTGFEQEVEFRNARTGAGIAKSSRLRYDRENNQSQGIYRGDVSGMADVTLVDLAEFQPRPGTQVSVAYDNQWGRGTCSNR